ncbi:site-specific integrase [Streptomyces zingiberis]|uniref:Site-specific integrase n=1 Tax=Streptomyces zingiberis TaxID=2053010 RepID=A0ABX1C6I8_9ACTN|nr:site-specific integrase [Streptomyces zingiberis]NJQ03552.1 site-specific integrase [Streptomyces zingiberis]
MSRRNRLNGEGTITRRKDGRWEAAAYVPTSAGTFKRKRHYGRTRAEAHAKLVRMLEQAHRGIPVADKAWTVGDYLTYWIEHVVAPRRRPKTLLAYESAVRLYLVPLLGGKRLERLAPRDVQAMLARLRDLCLCCARQLDVRRPEAEQCCSRDRCCGRHLSARMVQLVHAVLRNALQSAVREELVSRNVAKLVQVEGPSYARGKGLDTVAARELLATVRGDRLYALYLLAVTLGLRKGELLGLRWDVVDLDRGELAVTRSLQRINGELVSAEPKTRHSRRTIPLPSFVRDALRARCEQQRQERAECGGEWMDSGHVFTTAVGSPVDPRNLNRHWYALQKRTGLEGYRFHDLRHSFVSLLLDLGVAPHIVREIAGHSDLQVTLGIYAHASPEEKRKALTQLSDLFGTG